MEPIKPYKKAFDYSYTLGAFPTFELLEGKPDKVKGVYLHSSFTESAHIKAVCREKSIPVFVEDKIFHKISDKENCFVIGVLDKYEEKLMSDKSHLVLGNPSNRGNLGTILRTALCMGINDVAIIAPGADVFNPKTIRASMGALFKMRVSYYDSFEEYQSLFKAHDIFTFMLNGENTLEVQNCPKTQLFSLVFGNEATGLDDSFLNVGTSVFIPQSPQVDSLNITIAVGIASFIFTHQNT